MLAEAEEIRANAVPGRHNMLKIVKVCLFFQIKRLIVYKIQQLLRHTHFGVGDSHVVIRENWTATELSSNSHKHQEWVKMAKKTMMMVSNIMSDNRENSNSIGSETTWMIMSMALELQAENSLSLNKKLRPCLKESNHWNHKCLSSWSYCQPLVTSKNILND